MTDKFVQRWEATLIESMLLTKAIENESFFMDVKSYGKLIIIK